MNAKKYILLLFLILVNPATTPSNIISQAVAKTSQPVSDASTLMTTTSQPTI